MKDDHPHVVTPLLQPKNICHKTFFKAYCLITATTTSNVIELVLIPYRSPDNQEYDEAYQLNLKNASGKTSYLLLKT